MLVTSVLIAEQAMLALPGLLLAPNLQIDVSQARTAQTALPHSFAQQKLTIHYTVKPALMRA